MKKLLLTAALASLALASAALAQAPPPPPGGPAGPPPEVVVKEYFGLTEEQAAGFDALLEARRQAIQAILPQLDAAEKALGEALGAPSPDPAQLGDLLLVAHGFREQIHQAEDAMVVGFNALLTAEQRAKVAEVLALMKAMPALDAMHRLRLLPPPPEGSREGATTGIRPPVPPQAPRPPRDI